MGYWGTKVRTIWKLWEFIIDDLEGYAAAHRLDEHGNHVCLVEPCLWDHVGAKTVSGKQTSGELQQMRATMLLVVTRYVKPWTKDYGAGLSFILNAGLFARYDIIDNATEEYCKAKVFISHTWSERFQDFATTLVSVLGPEETVWVCSFA